MEYKHQQQATRSWTTRRDEKKGRMQLVSSWMSGPLLPREKLVESLEALIAPADRIELEGDNQKQADFLSLFHALWPRSIPRNCTTCI